MSAELTSFRMEREATAEDADVVGSRYADENATWLRDWNRKLQPHRSADGNGNLVS